MFPKRAFVFAGVLLVLGGGIAVASLRGEPQRELAAAVDMPASHLVTASELADWIVTGRRDFAVVDMRAPVDFQTAHVRGAVNCGSCHENRQAGREAQQGESFVDLSKKLVLYTETDREPVTLPKILQENPRLYRLAGGFAAWQEKVLAPVSFEGLFDDESLLAAKKRDAVRAFMAGERPAAGNVAKLPITPIKRVGAHKPAGGGEGC
jgi:rhodanese-related sulfurtransferase